MDGKCTSDVAIWKDLTLVEAESILKCTTPKEVDTEVRKLIGKLSTDTQTKEDMIIIDMYIYLFQFAIKMEFSPPQLSVLYTLQKRVHEMCVSVPYENMTETFTLFKEILLCHSVNRPPFSVLVFEVDQVKRVTDYFLSTYFKHYRMYKYAFTKKQRLNITIHYPDLPPLPTPEESTDLTDDTGLNEVEDSETEKIAKEEELDPGDQNIDKPALSPREVELEKMIKSQLSDQLDNLQLTMTKELSSYDQKISSKITELETSIGKFKGKKK